MHIEVTHHSFCCVFVWYITDRKELMWPGFHDVSLHFLSLRNLNIRKFGLNTNIPISYLFMYHKLKEFCLNTVNVKIFFTFGCSCRNSQELSYFWVSQLLQTRLYLKLSSCPHSSTMDIKTTVGALFKYFTVLYFVYRNSRHQYISVSCLLGGKKQVRQEQ